MYYIFNRYISIKSIFIWVTEAVLTFLMVLFVTSVRFGFDPTGVSAYDPSYLKSLVLTAAYLVTFYYFDLYSAEHYRLSRQMALKLIQATLVATLALFCIFFLFPSLKAWRGIMLLISLALPFCLVAWRSLFLKFLNLDMPTNRVLIVGSGDLAKKIGSVIFKEDVHGLKLIGFIDDDPTKIGQSIVNPGVIGGYGDIRRLVSSEKIDRIIIALNDRRAKLPMSALLDCKLAGVVIEEGETFNERLSGKIPLDHLKPSWMVFSDGFRSLRSRKTVKRVIDVVLSLVCLILTLPIFLITAILIKLDSRGPVIFKQVRVGENGKHFNVYKFRSMRTDAESASGPVWASKKDDRVTRVGRVIRKIRVDELPQVINVLKGDMSFVGPRPERPFFVDKLKEVIPYYEIRNIVKPGITGWAQIKYPYGATIDDAVEKLQYDIYYIKNLSPMLDIMIFFWTIKVVLTGRGGR